MNVVANFTTRNLKIYFRDKSAVLFSLLAVFIILGLYLVFLGDVWTEDIPLEQAQELLNSWIVAGLLAVTSITTSLGAFSTMVEDKAKKISKDFYSAPVPKSNIITGYILSAFSIGVIMSFLTFALGEVYIIVTGGVLLPIGAMIKIFGLIILTTMTNTAIIFLIVSFVSSMNAFTSISTILGTLIGFLTGMYLPIGELPEGVQFVMKCFPPTYGAGMLRQVMMEEVMKESFKDIPTEYLIEFKEKMGVVFSFGNHFVSTSESIAILLITAVLLFGLATMNLSRKKR